MNKKMLASLLVFALLLFSSVCFATNAGEEVQNSADKSKTTMENMGQGIENMAQDVGNGIQGAASSVGNAVQGAASDIGNGVQDMFDGNDNTQNSTTGVESMGTDSTGYSATRTSASLSDGMANTAWIWLILGIVGVVIVSLDWYYVSQDTTRKR
mgnify:CR=1 FL=1